MSSMSIDTEFDFVQTDLDRLAQSSLSLIRTKDHLGQVDETLAEEAKLFLSRRGIDLPGQWRMLRSIGLGGTNAPIGAVKHLEVEVKPEESMKEYKKTLTESLVDLEADAVLKELETSSHRAKSIEWRKESDKQVQMYLNAQEDIKSFQSHGALEESIAFHYAKELSMIDIDLRKGKSPQVSQRFAQMYDYPLVRRIASTDESSLNPSAAKNIWTLLSHCLNEQSKSLSQFRSGYAGENTKGKCRQFLIDNAVGYFQHLYRSIMERSVEEWSYRSTPDQLGKLKIFVERTVCSRVDARDLGFCGPLMHRTHPFWSMLFYCFRSGKKQAAISLMKTAERDANLEGIALRIRGLRHFIETMLDENLVISVKQLEDERNRNVFQQIQEDYRLHVARSMNPFEVAVYLVCSICEPFDDISLFRHADHVPSFSHFIIPTIDDYMWFRLKLLREDPLPTWIFDEFHMSRHVFSIQSLQDGLKTFMDDDYFEKDQKPTVYFQILLFSQQWEEALAFIRGIDATLALHMSIVFKMYNLQGLCQSSSCDTFNVHKPLDEYLSVHFARRPRIAYRYLDILQLALQRSEFFAEEFEHIRFLVFRVLERSNAEEMDELIGPSGLLLHSFDGIASDAMKYFEHISDDEKVKLIKERFVPLERSSLGNSMRFE